VRKAKPCAVCGRMTTGFLFNDKELGIPICSRKCEFKYIDTLTPNMKEQMKVLYYIDSRIEKAKQHEHAGWAISGFGLLTVLIGFLTANTSLFIIGVAPLTYGALSTRHFEDKRDKLVRLRKRILI